MIILKFSCTFIALGNQPGIRIMQEFTDSPHYEPFEFVYSGGASNLLRPSKSSIEDNGKHLATLNFRSIAQEMALGGETLDGFVESLFMTIR